MKKVVVVADSDKVYGERFAEYFTERNAYGLGAVACADEEEFKKQKERYSVPLIFTTPELYEKIKIVSDGKPIIILSEDGLNTTKEYAVFKYRRASEIVREAQSVYNETCGDTVRVARVFRSRLIGIFSPVGRSGKTAMAITLGMMLSKDAKVLLITLDEFAGVFRYVSCEALSDFSDLLYLYRTGKLDYNRLNGCIYEWGRLRYIPPVRYSQDVGDVPPECMRDLILKISSEGDFDYIVLDIGSYVKRGFDIFGICDELYMTCVDDEVARCKTDEFNELVRTSGAYGKLQVQEVVLPLAGMEIRELVSAERYLHGELFEKVKEIYCDGRESRRDGDE